MYLKIWLQISSFLKIYWNNLFTIHVKQNINNYFENNHLQHIFMYVLYNNCNMHKKYFFIGLIRLIKIIEFSALC